MPALLRELYVDRQFKKEVTYTVKTQLSFRLDVFASIE